MSILHYQPTSGYRDTARNTREFINTNMDVFWDIFKPLAPFFATFLFLDLIIAQYFLPSDPEMGGMDQSMVFNDTVGYYFLICLIVSWHRVIIQGPDRYERMNPFKPKKSEIIFLLMAIAVIAGPLLASFIIAIIASSILPALAPIIATIMVIAAIYVMTRLSFYFPGKATESGLSIKNAYVLSKGFVLRVLFAPLLAMWKVILQAIGYVICVFVILWICNLTIPGLLEIKSFVIAGQFILLAPVYLYFYPILTIYGVTVVSNFYQFALQNPKNNDTYIG